MSKKGREYKKSIHDLYASDDIKPVTVPMKIGIQLYPPDRRDRDADNYVKAILDGLKWLGYIEDDSLFRVILVMKHDKLEEYNKGLALIYIVEDKRPSMGSVKVINDTMLELGFKEHEMEYFHKPKIVKKDNS